MISYFKIDKNETSRKKTAPVSAPKDKPKKPAQPVQQRLELKSPSVNYSFKNSEHLVDDQDSEFEEF